MFKSILTKIIPIIFIISCSNDAEKVEFQLDDIYEKDGLYYSKVTNELFSGTTYDYFKSGSLRYKDTYENGMVSFMNEYYESGAIKSKYTYKNGNLNGLYAEFHENGFTKSLGIKKEGTDNFITVKGSKSGLFDSISCSLNKKEENLAACLNLIFYEETCLEDLLADQNSTINCSEDEYANSFENGKFSEFAEDFERFYDEIWEFHYWPF